MIRANVEQPTRGPVYIQEKTKRAGARLRTCAHQTAKEPLEHMQRQRFVYTRRDTVRHNTAWPLRLKQKRKEREAPGGLSPHDLNVAFWIRSKDETMASTPRPVCSKVS